MTPVFYLVVALFSQGPPLASNLQFVGPLSAQECIVQAQVVEGDPAYIVPEATRTVRCMTGQEVSNLLFAEESCTLIEGAPGSYNRDYACTGKVRS
jgi:hypothetical protein